MTEKTALITGASRGLGAALAEELAAAGTHVIALARTPGALEELDDRIQAAGGSATLVPLDITDETGIQRLCLNIHERWDGLDLWVHSAIHAAPLTPAGHVAEKDWDKSVDINLRATQRLIANLEPLLLAKSGTAILPCDTKSGEKFFAAYGATKAAQKALFDSWAAETTDSALRVICVEPKAMPTATRARFFPGEDRARLSHPSVEAKRVLQQL
ncbi:MAG: SDR family oxidoreductase [Rhodobacteraceae bacterium]|nr:SDR family oxidoreductase [Paracoccaceae bacterium]